MATIKAYTDLSQSKKLTEILPLESADMFYNEEAYESYPKNIVDTRYPMIIREGQKHYLEEYGTPCWSLAALLDVLPKKYYPIKDHNTDLTLGKPKDKWCVLYWDATGMQDGEQTLADNPIDACYEMIVKLHELKML